MVTWLVLLLSTPNTTFCPFIMRIASPLRDCGQRTLNLLPDSDINLTILLAPSWSLQEDMLSVDVFMKCV